MYLEYVISLYQGQHHLVNYPRKGEATLLIWSMNIFFSGGGGGGGEEARFTQANHEFIITSEREDGLIQPLRWND